MEEYKLDALTSIYSSRMVFVGSTSDQINYSAHIHGNRGTYHPVRQCHFQTKIEFYGKDEKALTTQIMLVSRNNLFFCVYFLGLGYVDHKKNKEYHQTYLLTKCFSCLTLTIVHFPQTAIFANLVCHMQIL